MYRNFKKNGEGGFTLIEVMVAVTILAGMALAMFGASSQMLRSKDIVEDRDEKSHSVSFALNKMAEDLNAAYIVKSKDLLGTKFEGEVSFEGKEERLDFVCFNHLRYIRNAKEADSAEVSYYLISDEENPDLRILMRRESPSVDNDRQAGGKAYPLLEGVRSIRFEYLPGKSDEYKSVWDTTSVDSGNILPRAVKISLEVMMPEEENPRQFTTLAPIRLSKPLEF